MSNVLGAEPTLSIVIPVAKNWLPYLKRTVLSIAEQGCAMHRIEVIISVDGGDSNKAIARAVRPSSQPFRCKIIDSPRPHGANVPHRNHARNAGCRAASGELLWVLDADQMMEHGTIDSILETYTKCKLRGAAPILLFPIYRVAYTPEKWIDHTDRWLKGNESLQSLFSRTAFVGGEFDGFAQQYAKQCNRTKSSAVRKFHENMPVFPACIWRALGGFNEKFLYWGGNKEEFTRRLNGLSDCGWVETRLISNRRLVHQSHPVDPMRTRFDLKPIRANADRFHRILQDIIRGAPWWIKSASKVGEELRMSGFQPVDGFGIICRNPCNEFLRNAKKLVSSTDIPIHFIVAGRRRKHGPAPSTPWITYLDTPSNNEVVSIHCGVQALDFNRFAILDLEKHPDLDRVFKILSSEDNYPCFKPNEGIYVMTQRQYNESGGLAFHCFTSLPYAIEELMVSMKNLEYKDQVAEFVGDYKLRVPVWELMGITELADKPRISLGILTYNRRDKLEECVNSLIASLRPDLFEYDIVISDDCSTDDTPEYLASLDHPFFTILDNPRRGGVAAQANRLLNHFDGNVEFGFLSNDDILFTEGWEELYSYAMAKTGYSHFTFMDLVLETQINPLIYPPHDIMDVNGIKLVNWRRMRLQGCFMTFDQRVIDLVGGMDSVRFKLFGHEHVDWTVRNRRAGLAPGGIRWMSGTYDVLGSHNVLSLNLENYRRSTAPEDEAFNTEAEFNKIENISERVYIPITNGIESEVCIGSQE